MMSLTFAGNVAQENSQERELRHMYQHVHRSVIYNSDKLETTQMSWKVHWLGFHWNSGEAPCAVAHACDARALGGSGGWVAWAREVGTQEWAEITLLNASLGNRAILRLINKQ